MIALPRPLRAAALAAWVVLIVVGGSLVVRERSSSGAVGVVPREWPSASAIQRDPGKSTLVMFVHPRCPCTRASLLELNEIMNAEGERASAVVVFLRPSGVSDGWERTDSWERAGELPQTTRVVDRDGTEAARFGAHTSGHALLYSPSGHLLFSGGITAGRGHAGDNVGRQSVVALIRSDDAPHDHVVFGCALEPSENNR